MPRNKNKRKAIQAAKREPKARLVASKRLPIAHAPTRPSAALTALLVSQLMKSN